MSLRRRKLKCLSKATNIDKGYLCTSIEHHCIIMYFITKVIQAQYTSHTIRYLRYHYYSWRDTSFGGLYVFEGIIIPVVSVSTLTWLSIYIYYWNSISTKVTYALVEQEVLTLPGHPISPPDLVGFVLLDL
jgi:hypothetical protein